MKNNIVSRHYSFEVRRRSVDRFVTVLSYTQNDSAELIFETAVTSGLTYEQAHEYGEEQCRQLNARYTPPPIPGEDIILAVGNEHCFCIGDLRTMRVRHIEQNQAALLRRGRDVYSVAKAEAENIAKGPVKQIGAKTRPCEEIPGDTIHTIVFQKVTE